MATRSISRPRPTAISTGDVLHVTKRSQTFRFTDVPSPPVPSLLRGFSAPVNLTIDLADRDLEFLMANDRDLFNSLAGRQHIRHTDDDRDRQGPAQGRACGARHLVRQGARGVDLRSGARARLSCRAVEELPSQSDIAREMGRNVDPALIFRAHRQLSSSSAPFSATRWGISTKR